MVNGVLEIRCYYSKIVKKFDNYSKNVFPIYAIQPLRSIDIYNM